MSISCRRATVVVVAACVLGASLQGVAAAGGMTHDESPVILLDAGDQSSTVHLPIAAAVGNAAAFHNEQTFDATIHPAIGATHHSKSGMTWSGATTVVTLAADGGHVQRLRIDDADGTGDFREMYGFDPDLLTGLTFAQTIEADGRLGSLEYLDNGRVSGAARQLATGFFVTLPLAFPEADIGVGARWVWRPDIPILGFMIPARYEFVLTELTADDYLVTLTWDIDVDIDAFGTQFSGPMAGTATLRGSRHNGLIQSFVSDELRHWTIDDQRNVITLDAAAQFTTETAAL